MNMGSNDPVQSFLTLPHAVYYLIVYGDCSELPGIASCCILHHSIWGLILWQRLQKCLFKHGFINHCAPWRIKNLHVGEHAYNHILILWFPSQAGLLSTCCIITVCLHKLLNVYAYALKLSLLCIHFLLSSCCFWDFLSLCILRFWNSCLHVFWCSVLQYHEMTPGKDTLVSNLLGRLVHQLVNAMF